MSDTVYQYEVTFADGTKEQVGKSDCETPEQMHNSIAGSAPGVTVIALPTVVPDVTPEPVSTPPAETSTTTTTPPAETTTPPATTTTPPAA